MQDLQEIFDKMQELKKEQKELGRAYKNELAADPNYENVVEEVKQVKIKKEQIETETKNSLGRDWDRFEEVKREIAALQEMASDVAFNTLVEGKSIELKDKYNNEYAPVYKVSFKKIQ
ncbi:MAG: hypothetical protein KC736_04315 [Candidatus Moranbacteria bacterium]|nr:hypothetical protein [Candidatus Moranbacteria bacterium]